MSQQKRHITMSGQENFRISDVNPNAGVGLPGCLGCGSHRCPGPFMVFPTQVAVPGSRRMAYISISLACAKKAVLNYERGSEIQRIGSGRPEDEAMSLSAFINSAPEAIKDQLQALVDQARLSNPYFVTGVGRDGVPLHRILEEMRTAAQGSDPWVITSEEPEPEQAVADDDGMAQPSTDES